MVNKNIFTLVLTTLQVIFALKINQVPIAKDLINHFGSEPRRNLYGPHHFIDKNSYLYNDDSFLSNLDNQNSMIIASGKINGLTQNAENIVSPILPIN